MSRRLGALAAALILPCAMLGAACGEDDEALPPEPTPEEAGQSQAPQYSRGDGAVDERPPNLPQVECAVGAEIEREDNDTPEQANELTATAFCGVISDPDDVDYITFETPQGTKLTVFQAVIDGPIDFELTLNGETFGPAATSKFGSGRYLVKAFTKGEPGTYRLRIQFD
ncbi:MAG: PPC domain-containing protein [Labilithrix sp.]|nr:PPC domain-containing protein [Labilithrix sp.]